MRIGTVACIHNPSGKPPSRRDSLVTESLIDFGELADGYRLSALSKAGVATDGRCCR